MFITYLLFPPWCKNSNNTSNVSFREPQSLCLIGAGCRDHSCGSSAVSWVVLLIQWCSMKNETYSLLCVMHVSYGLESPHKQNYYMFGEQWEWTLRKYSRKICSSHIGRMVVWISLFSFIFQGVKSALSIFVSQKWSFKSGIRMRKLSCVYMMMLHATWSSKDCSEPCLPYLRKSQSPGRDGYVDILQSNT